MFVFWVFLVRISRIWTEYGEILRTKKLRIRTLFTQCLAQLKSVGLRHIAYIVMRCAIWYNLYNLKNAKDTHGGVLILLKLQAKACNFTKSNAPHWVFFTIFKLACNFNKSNTPPWVSFTFFKLCKWYQIAQSITCRVDLWGLR